MIGNVISYSLANALTVVTSSPLFIPITNRLSGVYLLWASSRWGNSSLHGPHHVAQKLRTMGVPWYLDMSIVELDMTLTCENSGALLPTSTIAVGVLSAVGPFVLVL